jgi:tRNA-modifying protein YgfZ
MTDSRDGYAAVNNAVGMIDRSDRVRVDVEGPDRARFLHNLTTNDAKRLSPGRGCEAFVTNLQGKTLGFVTLLACEDRILVRSEAGALGLLQPHFAKYGALEDVSWADLGPATFEFHLAGPRAEELLGRLGASAPEPADYAHVLATLAGREVRLVRESPTGRPGYTILGPSTSAADVAAAIHTEGAALGLAVIDPETFEALRIEAGTPAFGRDVTAENLPQEVGRDRQAINFVKGCYLGQETVARIDALGHVNKLLKGLKIEEGAAPPPGMLLEAGGKPVGTITSSALSPGSGRPIALAYVRVGAAALGTELKLADGRSALVADLPMIPRGG